MDNNKSGVQLVEEIDLSVFLLAFLKNWWKIGVSMIICAVVAFAGTSILIPKTYESYFTAYINNANNGDSTSVSSSDINASRTLASTYATILTSQPNIEAAIAKSGVDLTYKDLKGAVTVDDVNNTEVIKISVIYTDPEISFKLASALESLAPDYVSDIVSGSSMKLITRAAMPEGKVGPNPLKNAILAAIAGVLLSMCVIVVLTLLDDRIQDPDSLSRYGIVTVGTIHDLSKKNDGGHYAYSNSRK